MTHNSQNEDHKAFGELLFFFRIFKYVGGLIVGLFTLAASVVAIISLPTILHGLETLNAKADVQARFSLYADKGQAQWGPGELFSTPIDLSMYLDNSGAKETDFWRVTLLPNSTNLEFDGLPLNAKQLNDFGECNIYLIESKSGDTLLPPDANLSKFYGRNSPDIKATMKVRLNRSVLVQDNRMFLFQSAVSVKYGRGSRITSWYFDNNKEGNKLVGEEVFSMPTSFPCK
jgi:hypothetical protein